MAKFTVIFVPVTCDLFLRFYIASKFTEIRHLEKLSQNEIFGVRPDGNFAWTLTAAAIAPLFMALNVDEFKIKVQSDKLVKFHSAF